MPRMWVFCHPSLMRTIQKEFNLQLKNDTKKGGKSENNKKRVTMKRRKGSSTPQGKCSMWRNHRREVIMEEAEGRITSFDRYRKLIMSHVIYLMEATREVYISSLQMKLVQPQLLPNVSYRLAYPISDGPSSSTTTEQRAAPSGTHHK